MMCKPCLFRKKTLTNMNASAFVSVYHIDYEARTNSFFTGGLN